MTRRERWLQFAAQALGGGTLWGVWVAFMGLNPFTKDRFIPWLLVLSLAALLLMALGTKLLSGTGYLPALGRVSKAFLFGVLMGLAMAALILLLAELLTAMVGMATLIGYGG